MNCYVCDRAGRVTAAVALCRTHLSDQLVRPGPGGTSCGCSHEPAGWAHARNNIKEERR